MAEDCGPGGFIVIAGSASGRRRGVGDIRRPDEPLTLHPAISPSLTSGLDHPLEPVRTREVLRVRAGAECLPLTGSVTAAAGPPKHPCGQAAIGAPSLLNPCRARASELSRCHPRLSGPTADSI